ncbi:MAG: Txe/YoeB family toxin of Txe-Axe toxin-antitoxin module [Patescibacteria group bacterium]|jgi:Txe/YoeB family toxin of Txe-Axe toxin-antitoxin module
MGMIKKSDGLDFSNISIRDAFMKVKETDEELYKHLQRAFNDILENAFCGIQIPKKLFPKEYSNLNNLWKYNLPSAWRLLYTIKSPNKVEIITVVLDWMNHKDYERLFNF